MLIAPARACLRTNWQLIPVVSVRSAFFGMCFVVAFFAECSAIAHIILQLRIFIPVLDVVSCCCSNRQPFGIEPSIPLALFAQVAGPPQDLLCPFLMPGRIVVFIVRHLSFLLIGMQAPPTPHAFALRFPSAWGKKEISGGSHTNP